MCARGTIPGILRKYPNAGINRLRTRHLTTRQFGKKCNNVRSREYSTPLQGYLTCAATSADVLLLSHSAPHRVALHCFCSLLLLPYCCWRCCYYLSQLLGGGSCCCFVIAGHLQHLLLSLIWTLPRKHLKIGVARCSCCSL